MFSPLLNTRTVFLASGLLVAGLGLTCLSAPVDAAPRRAARTTKREPQRVSNAQLHEALHVLRVTKTTLEGADHDYGGHRASAVKAIGAAQHQLKLALHTQTKQKNPGKGAKGKGKGKGREPQNISNRQLADAIPILVKTMTMLEKADHDYGGHRAAAVRDLGAACQRLKAALAFEKKK